MEVVEASQEVRVKEKIEALRATLGKRPVMSILKKVFAYGGGALIAATALATPAQALGVVEI